ncbi:MAG: LEPR-XLL domain-containing protein, partial [Planctomycetes bacterium]|nr:LEPR-XLL domain-containing protein [Planctomycetota bacterium]
MRPLHWFMRKASVRQSEPQTGKRFTRDSLRFEPLEQRMLLSVAPGPAKGLDDELFLPTGGYVDESQFLPTGGYVDESQFLPTGSCDVFSGDAATQTARFDFAFEGAPTIEQFADGVLVTLDGEETWLAVGDPVVPVHQSSFVLPEGMAITSVEITYLDTGVVIGSGMQLLAAPTAVALDGSLPTGDEWTEVVSTSFPDAEAASFSNYSMAGYQIGSLRVFPVEYDA